MSELSSAATAAGTRENILVVASNSNSEALLAEAAAAVAISPISGNTQNRASANFHSQQKQSQVNISGPGNSKTTGISKSITSSTFANNNSLTPNSALYGTLSNTTTSPLYSSVQHAAAISQSSSRSSLCTPRSSTSLLSSTDIDMLIDMHSINSSGGSHYHGHKPSHYSLHSHHPHQNLNFATQSLNQMPSHHPSLPVIGTPGSFLTANVARHSLHLATTTATTNNPLNPLEDSNGNSILSSALASHVPQQFNSNRLFLDVINNNNNNSSNVNGSNNPNSNTAVKLRNKMTNTSAAAAAAAAQKHNKLMALMDVDSGHSMLLPSASSSSSSMMIPASVGYLSQAAILQQQQQQSNATAQSPHHNLQHSYSNSSMHQHSPSNMHQRNQQANFSNLGVPPSSASLSQSSNSAQFGGHQQQQSTALPQHYPNASLPQLVTDNDDYFTNNAKLNVLRNSGCFSGSSAASAAAHQVPASLSTLFLNQFRNKSGSFSASVDARNDFESLYRKYADLDNFHSELVSKLSMQVAENQTLRKRIEELLKINQNLQQQRQSDVREIELLKAHLESVKKQRDDANKECKNAILSKSKAIKEKQRMYEERNTALHEYNLIMSERDSVHKEIERLNEDLGNIARRSETLEKENKSYSEEVESLKRELASALMDRDQALKMMCSELKQQQQHSIYGTIEGIGSGHGHGHGHGGHHSSGHGYYSAETATAESSSSSLQLGHHHHAVSPTQHLDHHHQQYHHNSPHRIGSLSGLGSHHHHQHSFYQSKTEPLRATLKGINYLSNSSMSSAVSSPFKIVSTDANDQQLTATTNRDCSSPMNKSAASQSQSNTASPEQTEILRKQFDRLQIELQDAYQEIEVCKKRRDWAFSERDKIVQERESIRTLCDKLRRERDRKVSDLAEALRESDEIKRQKNETVKELQELKEKFDFNKANSDVMANTSTNIDQQILTKEVTINPKVDFSCQTTQEDLASIVTNGNYFGLPDCELIEVHLKRKSVNEEWGFKMKVDDAFDIIISSLHSGASPKLCVYDQLVSINDVEVTSLLTANVEKKMFYERAESLLSKAGLEMRLQLRRRRLVRTVQNVCLPVPVNDHQTDYLDKSFLQQFGFDAECALIVNRVDPNATTVFSNNLAHGFLDAGDRIIAINGNSLNNLFGKSLVHFMMQQPKGAQAQVVRFVPNRWAMTTGIGRGPLTIGHIGRELSICVDENFLPPMMTPPPPPPMYLLESATNHSVPQALSSDLRNMSYHVPKMAISPPPPPLPPLIHSPNMQAYGDLSTLSDQHQHYHQLQKQLQTPQIMSPPRELPKESNLLHFPPMTSDQYASQFQQPTKMTAYDESKAALQKAEENLAMKTMQSVSQLTATQHLHLLQMQEHPKLLQEQQHKQLQQELRQENEQQQQKLQLLQQQKLLKQKQLLNEQKIQLEAESSIPAVLNTLPGLSTNAAHSKTQGQLVDCSSSEDENNRNTRVPAKSGGVVDEENDADADDDASTTTASGSDTATEEGNQTYEAPEDIALAKFDKVLDQYQVIDSNTDYYGSTMTNSSVSSLTVTAPPVTGEPNALKQPMASIEKTSKKQSSRAPATTTSKGHSQQSQQGLTNNQPVASLQQQPQPGSASVVRRSSRHSASSKKSRSQRCTLGASQMAEAAHEWSSVAKTATVANNLYGLSGSATAGAAGDTWPRYRPPHQLLSSILPAFYQNHGEELQEIYAKQGPAAAAIAAVNSTTAFQQTQQLQPLPNYSDHLNYLTNIHHPRRKLRKSLGANFNDLFYQNTTASSNNNQSTPTPGDGCLTHTNTGSNSANIHQVVMRRSPRTSEGQPSQPVHHQSDQLNALDYGVIGIPFEHHHQMVFQDQSQQRQHSTTTSTGTTLNRDHLRQTMPSSVTTASSRTSGHFGKGISSIEQTLPPPPLPPGTSAYSSSGTSPSAQHFLQMEAEAQKLESLYRSSSNYSSIKLAKSSGSSAGTSAVTGSNYSEPQFNSGTSSSLVVGVDGNNTRSTSSIAAGRSSYSPIYASYSLSSSYRRPTAITSLDASSTSTSLPSTTHHQQSVSSSIGTTTTTTTSVDYSVVSAQSQDKDVLKYYKTRQASGSSQTGVPPAPITAALLLNETNHLLSMSATNTSLGLTMASDINNASSSSVQSGKTGSVYRTNTPSQSVSRSHHLLPEDLYGSIGNSVPRSALTVSASSAGPAGSITNPRYSTSSNTSAAAAAAAFADLYGTTRRDGGKSQAIANAVADINGTVGRKSASAGNSAANSHTPSSGSQSLYDTSVVATVSVASSTYGLSPHLQQLFSSSSNGQVLLPSARHSMNLGNLQLNLSGNSSNTAAASPSHSLAAPPPLYEQHLAHHLATGLDLYGPPGSNKTLPGKHSNTLLAISAAAATNPRASYKDGSYSHRVSPSLYLPYSSASAFNNTAAQHGLSRSTSINASQLTAANSGQQQQQLLLQQQQQQQQQQNTSSYQQQQHLSPDRSSIYGSLFVKNLSGGGQSTATADDVAQLSNFEQNFSLALNMIGPSGAVVASSVSPEEGGGQSITRLSRLRILSGANTNAIDVSMPRGSQQSSGLSVVEPSGRHSATATMMVNPNLIGVSGGYLLQPPPSSSSSGLFYGSGTLPYHQHHHLPSSSVASCGDRSSLVSSTGLPQAPLEIKWMRCTKDGSPGSPILDVSQAKADDYRLISIERSTALLGIQILKTNKCKGVFVKRVTEGSLAAQAGIQVGDQIIDICGINMRTADYENAAKVLKQCGDPIQMLVQYQYDKFKEIWSSMTEAERCNSLDSVGNACNSSIGSAHPPVLGTGRNSVDQSRRSADSMTEEEQLNEHLRRAAQLAHRVPIIGPMMVSGDHSLSPATIATSSSSTSSFSHVRYSSTLVDAGVSAMVEGQLSGTGGSNRAIRRGSSRRSTVVGGGGDNLSVSTGIAGVTAEQIVNTGAPNVVSGPNSNITNSNTCTSSTSTSGLVIYHSRHSTLTNDDITSTSTASAASTLTRRPKVASLPHECSLLSNSPTSTSNEDQSSHHSVTTTTTTSASSSQANMSTLPMHYSSQLPSVFSSISSKQCDASSTRALHGSSAPLFSNSPPSTTSTQYSGYHQQHHHHHGRENSLSPSAVRVGGIPDGDGDGETTSLAMSSSSTATSNVMNQTGESGDHRHHHQTAEEEHLTCERSSAKDPQQQQQHSPTASEVAAAAANIDKEEFDQYRSILIENTTSSLGISLVGGNAIGIFVHQIRDEQLLSYGLAPGDQIIEYNGTDLRHSTAEEAAIELAKPTDVIKMVVYYNPKRYQQIQETTIGDSFYIRVAFDRPSIDGSLSFQKNSVLYIDNTMYQGVPGVWGAWSVNALGEKEKFGIIPSKYKAEEELMMKRCYDTSTTSANNRNTNNTNSNINNPNTTSGNSNTTSCMGPSNRRSFFRRRKNGSGSGSAFSTLVGTIHFRSSSRDSTSKEIACYSDLASLRGPPHVNAEGEVGNEVVETPLEYPVPPTYIKVKKLHYDFPRPVIIIGPLKEMFIEKLEQDFPYVFQRCIADVVIQEEASITQDFFEYWMEKEKLFDARRRGSYVECTTYSSVKKICDHNLHPLLDINQNKAVKRLSANNFHPIVVFLKFKSTKQIKEINRCPTEKLSSKAAKEMYEHSCKIEIELKEQINVTIAGNNLSYMCTQIKKHVDLEQQRALWM